MNNNLLIPGQGVYNPIMNYVRIYAGFSILDDIGEIQTKDKLYDYFDSYKKLTDLGSKLVIDISTEAEDLHITLKESNKEYILDWILDYTIERNFKKDQLEIWVSDFNCKKNVQEKFSHLVRTVYQLNNFSPIAHDIHNLIERKFERKFICPMSRISDVRKKFYNWIVESKLEDSFFYSYNAREIVVHPNDIYDKKLTLERYTNDTFSDSDRAEWATYTFQRNSVINIVSETLFSSKERPHFITEKTFRAISMGQPFIMLAQPNTLKLLQKYGFKTFSEFWDESYDNEEDDDLRFKMICELISNLNKKSIEELSKLYKEIIPILEHNYNNLISLDRYYEFHPRYTFNKIDIVEHNAINYIEKI